jgi:hypothetical protein
MVGVARRRTLKPSFLRPPHTTFAPIPNIRGTFSKVCPLPAVGHKLKLSVLTLSQRLVTPRGTFTLLGALFFNSPPSDPGARGLHFENVARLASEVRLAKGRQYTTVTSFGQRARLRRRAV